MLNILDYSHPAFVKHQITDSEMSLAIGILDYSCNITLESIAMWYVQQIIMGFCRPDDVPKVRCFVVPVQQRFTGLFRTLDVAPAALSSSALPCLPG